MADRLQPPANVKGLVQQLALLTRRRDRCKLLRASRRWWRPGLVGRLYDEVVRLARVDLRQADRLAQAAAWVASQIDNQECQALSLRAVGHVLYLSGKYQPAWERYQAALSTYERLGKELEAGRTLSGALHTLIYLGRYAEAVTCAQRARDIFSRHGDRLRLARLDTNMGNILYRQDRFEEALKLYQHAYAVFVEAGAPQDVAVALRNLAVCHISLNDFRKALETYREARAYSESHQMPVLVTEADYNIAYLHYLRGEYTRAIGLYDATRERCQALGDSYHQGLCDLDESEMYLELNLSQEGARLARRALGTFRKLGTHYESAKALTNLAIASSHLGDVQQALELFRKARDLFVREQNQVWIALIDLYRALLLYQQKCLLEARSLCESAFEFFSPSPLAGKAALCQLLLARIHLEMGQREEARRVCLAALQRLEQAETPALTYQACFVLGLIEERLGSPEAAYQAYLKAHERLENLRSHLKAEELKIAFLKDKLVVYESLVWMCLTGAPREANHQVAFTYIEQAKSRSLADLIAFRAHTLPATTEAGRGLVEQAHLLREQLNSYSRGIELAETRSATAAAPHLERFRRRARECERHLVETLVNLQTQDQEYAALQAAGFIDLEAIRATVPADAVLVQYYEARGALYACLLSQRHLEIVPLGLVSELRRVLELLRFQLSKFRLGPEYVHTYYQQVSETTDAHLRELYRGLISPIQDRLQTAHLIVAPHGFLHYLPFHALRDGERFLADRFSVSYTPSASVYYLCCTKKMKAPDRTLVLGIPDPSAPYILDEVWAVASVLPNSEVFLGAEATVSVLRSKGPESRFLHIATHGSFRQDNPMFSSIRLGDAQFSLFDLYELKLSAELVTLSGCGTGLNVVGPGDELLGLVRGLLYAGAQGMLVTLWDVNDQSTAEFMKLFYQQVRRNPNKARAVQRAMQALRETYPHPYYWAPFVFVGKFV